MAYFSFNLHEMMQSFRKSSTVEPVPANEVSPSYFLISTDPFAQMPMKIIFQNGAPRKIEIPGKDLAQSFAIYHELESKYPITTWPQVNELQYRAGLRNYLAHIESGTPKFCNL